jgi:hypothetical protein
MIQRGVLGGWAHYYPAILDVPTLRAGRGSSQPMARGDRRKCKCCLKLFRPDPRERLQAPSKLIALRYHRFGGQDVANQATPIQSGFSARTYGFSLAIRISGAAQA